MKTDIVSLDLVVIRCRDIKKSFEFYDKLGLVFKKERHATGPEHFSTQIGPTVFELYPMTKIIENTVRLGFKTKKLEEAALIMHEHVLTPVSESNGRRWVLLEDPDKNRVELVQA